MCATGVVYRRINHAAGLNEAQKWFCVVVVGENGLNDSVAFPRPRSAPDESRVCCVCFCRRYDHSLSRHLLSAGTETTQNNTTRFWSFNSAHMSVKPGEHNEYWALSCCLICHFLIPVPALVRPHVLPNIPATHLLLITFLGGLHSEHHGCLYCVIPLRQSLLFLQT